MEYRRALQILSLIKKKHDVTSKTTSTDFGSISSKKQEQQNITETTQQ